MNLQEENLKKNQAELLEMKNIVFKIKTYMNSLKSYWI